MNVALAVGGGIAAYKAAEVARLLQERGCAVQVVMTAAAQQFIQPLTFASLTGRKVITSLWSETDGDVLSSAVEHIRVAQDNHVLLVAPATADLIGKFAHGLADDFVSTLYLAFTGSVIVAPAMNTAMWNHAAVRENVQVLQARGVTIVDPDEGLLACGTTGPGRLATPERIALAVTQLTAKPERRQDLEGERVVVTAGPTREPLDPVRYISNRSSGKMGYALAEAAMRRGAKVKLISGPVDLPEPAGIDVVQVQTAVEMRKAVIDSLPTATIVVKAAAVADYHVADIPKHKIKKTAARMSIDLDPTPDILAEVGQVKGDCLLIGFAAETDNLIDEARKKLITKNCDMVVANLVNRENSGFESDQNEVVLVMKTGEMVPLALAPKREVADSIFDNALRLRLALHATAS